MLLRFFTFILLFSVATSFAKVSPFEPGGPQTLEDIPINETYNNLAAQLNDAGDPDPTWDDEKFADYERNLELVEKLRPKLRDSGEIGNALVTQSAKLMKARAERKSLLFAAYVNAAYKLEMRNYISLFERQLELDADTDPWTKEKSEQSLYLIDRLVESTNNLISMDRTYPDSFGKLLEEDLGALKSFEVQRKLVLNLIKDQTPRLELWLAKIKGFLK
jgi:hypothetical protein